MCFFRNKDVKMFESKFRPGMGKVRPAELFGLARVEDFSTQPPCVSCKKLKI